MIDMLKLEQYRENNRIEAKKAQGGLPLSLWETYSAFANTLGGILLLGVVENPDKTLRTVTLPDPERLVWEFWDLVRSPAKASVNILRPEDVTIETAGGNRIVAIRVPRARRTDRPVYVNGDLYRGTYRRSGEGDYRCTREEVDAMLRDAARQTADMMTLRGLDCRVLDPWSIRRFRAHVSGCHLDDSWDGLEDEEFLLRTGAAARDDAGVLHPTAGGLLFLGRGEAIARSFPLSSLLYREKGGSGQAMNVFSSESGCNLYTFYTKVYERLLRGLEFPDEARRETAKRAVREALSNCLVNADYRRRGGVVVNKSRDAFTFSNPGGFRIDLSAARSGGVSDPRNAVLSRLFSLINAARGDGGGISGLFAAWMKEGWQEPTLREYFDPDRVTLRLPLTSGQAEKSSRTAAMTVVKKHLIVDYLTSHACCKPSEIGAHVGLGPARTREYLVELIAEGVVVAERSGRQRFYRLKS